MTEPTTTTVHRLADRADPMAGIYRRTRRPWDGGTHLVILLLAAFGDAVNFTSALGLAMQDQPMFVLVIAVAALTASAVGLMHFAGISTRRWVAASRRGGASYPRAAAALTGFWLLLGLSLLFLRIKGHVPSTAPTSVSAFGAPASPDAPANDMGHIALTLMFFALYLATGAMAAWAGYGTYQPEQRAIRRAEKMRTRALERQGRAQAVVLALQAQVQEEIEELTRDEERYAVAVQGCNAWAGELREQARLRMAIAVGDPAGTSALT